MSIDVQLNVGFLDNWKIIKLRRRIGPDAVLSLLKLWCVARTSKPDGNLGHVTPEDLEIMSSWNGSPNAFYETIRDLRLIDETQDGVIIHDWHEHEAYVVKKTEKQQANIENGRKGGRKRVENMRERQAMACESSSDGLKTLEESSSNGLKTSRLSVAKCSVAECSEEKNSVAGVQGGNDDPPPSDQLTLTSDETDPFDNIEDSLTTFLKAEAAPKKKPSPAFRVQTLEEILSGFEASPAYKGIDVRREHAKMVEWVKSHPGRRITKKFMMNWLNKCEPSIDFAQTAEPDPKAELRLKGERCLARHAASGTNCIDEMRVSIPNLAHCAECKVRLDAIEKQDALEAF